MTLCRGGVAVIACLMLLVGSSAAAAAAVAPPTRPEAAQPLAGGPLLLILDASGSMNADDGTGRPKIEAAREAVLELIEGLPAEAQVGLRAYGHRTTNLDPVAGCADTELLVDVGADNRVALRAAVTGLQASGFTPIGTSLRASLEDLPDLPDGTPRTVVLVSDGIDTCAPPAACDVARQIISEGVELRVETVGFQVDAAAARELQCIADSTGGTYRPADDAEDLARELRAYDANGTPVERGPSPGHALTLAPGQYTDTLTYPTQRWYAVELQPGDRVRAAASVIGSEEQVAVPGAEIELVLGFADVIGLTPCASDRVTGVGPFTRTLTVDGLRVAGGTVCGDPGTYAVGLTVSPPAVESGVTVDRDAEEVLAASTLDVELLIAVTSDPVGMASETSTAVAPVVAPVGGDPGRAPTPASAYFLTGAGFLALGGLGGVVLSRWLGP